jgi:hypothetical protein
MFTESNTANIVKLIQEMRQDFKELLDKPLGIDLLIAEEIANAK